LVRLSGNPLSLLFQAAVVASVLVMCPLASEAQANNEAESLSLHTSFDHFWRRYLEAATAGDDEISERMLDEIKRLRVERNAFALNDVGASFAYQGYALLQSGNIVEAREHFEIARDLSPDLPLAYRGLASASAQAGGVGHATALLYGARARLAALRSGLDGPYARWNLGFVLFTGAMIVFFLFGALMLYRYGVLLTHDFEERFSDFLGIKGSFAAALAVFCLPLIATAGVGWLAPYWVSLTYGYQTKKERGISISCLVALLLAAPAMQLYPEWARTVSNPVYQAALSSTTGTFDIDDVLTLRESTREWPSDRDIQFLLAIQFKNLGDYELAAEQYRRILQDFPDDPGSQLNLGNIYFAQRDWEGALVQYDDVLAAHPRVPMAYYNKSLAHAENFQFSERESARAQAEGLDASAVSGHERLTGDYRVVADTKLDATDVFAKFAGLAEGIHERPVDPWVSALMSNGWGFRFVLAALGFGLLIALLELLFGERKLTQRCWKCGSAFCGRCQIGTGRKGLCTQCYHLFFMKDGVSSEARNVKLAQVQRAATLRLVVFRVLSLIAPGSGQISDGKPILGTLLLLVWVLGACSLFLDPPYSIPDGLLDIQAGPPVMLGAVMALVLIVANFVSRPMARG